MKARIKVITTYGVLVSKIYPEANEKEMKEFEDLIKLTCEKGTYFAFETEEGYRTCMPAGLIQKSLFIIEKIES